MPSCNVLSDGANPQTVITLNAKKLGNASDEINKEAEFETIFKAYQMKDTTRLMACIVAFANCQPSLKAFERWHQNDSKVQLPSEILFMIERLVLNTEITTQVQKYDIYRHCEARTCSGPIHTDPNVQEIEAQLANLGKKQSQQRWKTSVINVLSEELRLARYSIHLNNAQKWSRCFDGNDRSYRKAIAVFEREFRVHVKFATNSYNGQRTEPTGFLGFYKRGSAGSQIRVSSALRISDQAHLRRVLVTFGLGRPGLEVTPWLLVAAEGQSERDGTSCRCVHLSRATTADSV